MNPGENLGLTEYKIKSQHPAGPIGTRWVVQSQDAERLIDLVAPGSEYLNSLCHNVSRTKGWIENPAVSTVLEFGWLKDGSYYQVLDLPIAAHPHSAAAERLVDEPELWVVARQFLSGLKHLHDRELVHGALAPETIYRWADELKIAELWWVHNADGQALYEDLDRHLPRSSPSFLLPFMAPEMLKGAPPRRESDIFSLGAVLQFMLTGESPRKVSLPPGDKSYRQAAATAQLKFLLDMRPDLTEETAAIIYGMLNENPAERPNIFKLEAIFSYLAGEPQPVDSEL